MSTPPFPNLDSSDSGIIQRLTAVEVELRNSAETLQRIERKLFEGPDSHEGRLRILEALGNKGLAIIGVCGVIFGAALSMLFGWIPNPFAKGKP